MKRRIGGIVLSDSWTWSIRRIEWPSRPQNLPSNDSKGRVAALILEATSDLFEVRAVERNPLNHSSGPSLYGCPDAAY